MKAVDSDYQPPEMECSKVQRAQSSGEKLCEGLMTTGGGLSAAACSEAFRHHCGDLITAIQDPEVVATRLFSQHVVSDAVLEEVCMPTLTPIQRKTRLLSAIRNQIAVDPKAFGSLLQVLKMEPYLMDLAQRLEQTYRKCKSEPSIIKPQEHPQSVLISHSLDRSHAMATYASYLRSVYLRQKFPTYGKLPHSPSKKYTNLASVKKEPVSKEKADAFTRATIHGGIDDVVRKKVPITMEEIAVVKQGVWPKCILVEGVPGIGKSTFAWKMCREWGKGKILQDYKLVVLLSLREKKVREAKCVSELFRIYSRKLHKEVIDEVEKNEGRGVLLLFEGYDELPETLRTQDSLFLDIIRGKELPYATVLITSRPSASGFLYEECKDYLSQRIEIVGFSSKNVQSYLESTCGSDPSLLSGIQKYLQCYPHIRTMMYVPLNAAIVVEVYRTSKKDQSIVPRTMTQLYECLIRSLLRRYLNDHPVHGKRKWRLRKLDDLPPDVYEKLCELGKIAYKGIVNDRQVIFEDLPEDFVTLGLMQCVPELYVDEGAAVSHSFLHLTIQEFMAAFHLSHHPVEGQPNNNAPNQRMVMRFLAGLTGLKGTTFETPDTDRLSLDRDRLHLMFEAQRVADILKASEVSIHGTTTINWSRFDYFVLGYCISHSNSAWKLEIWRYDNEAYEVEELVHGALEHPVQSCGRITSYSLVFPRNIRSEDVRYMLKLPEHMLLSSLETLIIGWYCISPKGVELTSLLQQTTALRELTINSGRETTFEQCRSLASGLRTNGTLKRLSLSRIGGEEVEILSGALHENTTLQELSVDLVSLLRVAVAIALAKALANNRSLQTLSIGGIDSEGVGHLAKALHVNNTLQELSLSMNPIGVTGATALAEALTVNTSLRKLRIDNCNIGSEGACRLAGALHTNNTLQVLYMFNNPIGVTGATALAEALTINSTLRRLNISYNCNIDSHGACQLASALHTNNKLQDLDISSNTIHITGATALAEALTINTSLKSLGIADSSVGEQGVLKILNSLSQNSTLERLRLHRDYKHIVSSNPVRDTLKIIY